MKIVYKKIKRIHFKIREGEVIMTVPYRTPKEFIKKVINDNSALINEMQIKAETFSIWGEKYQLVYIKSDVDKVVVEDNCYCYYKNDQKKVLDKFFYEEAKKEIANLTKKYETVLSKNDLFYNKLEIKKLYTKWGSCKYKFRNIIINSRLAFYDKKFIEYVFFHELAHIKHPNHSRDFHEYLEMLYPDAKKVDKELKKCY